MGKFINKIKSFFGSRKMRYGTNAMLLTVVFIAVIVVINLIVGSFQIKADLTREKLFSFSDQTIEVLEGLKKPVNIYMIQQQGNEDPFIREILERYARRSDMISLGTIDPVREPDAVKKYEDDDVNISRGTILFESEGNVRAVQSYELVNYNQQTQTTDYLLAEQRFTSAIMYVVSDDIPVVYFVEGHGENELSLEIRNVLEQENYKHNSINLLATDIPDDAELLIIASPKRDFDAVEIEKLDKYFDVGGRAVFLFDIMNSRLDNIESYLTEWGVELRQDIIVEENKDNYYMYPTFLIPQIERHEITNRLVDNNLNMLVPEARSINILFDERRGVKVSSLMHSTEKSKGRVNLKTGEENAADVSGPLDIATAITRYNYDDVNKETRIVVLGSSSFLNSNILSMQGIANIDFFMNSLGWMIEREEQITIRPKSLRPERLKITSQTQLLINDAIVFLVIPLLVFIAGTIVWLRRRHL